MNSQGHLPTLLFLIAAFAHSEILGAEPLRYKFTEGATNAYRITLESPSQNTPMRFEGFVVVGVRAVDEDVATVFFRGRIQFKPGEGGRPMPGGQRQFGPRGPFGPPRLEPWRITNLTPFNEVQVDPGGRILRVSGLQDLPKPLETYADIFFQQLPTDLTKPLETEQPATLDEDGSGRSRMPGGFYPGGPGGGPGRLTGVRKERIEVAEKTDGLVRLQKNMEFRSHLKTDDQPRLAFSSKSELVFDPGAGALKSAKIEGNSSVATLEALQRSSLTVRIEQLEGDELAKAIMETAERAPVIAEVDVDKLVADLEGEDQPKRIEAAQRLLSADIEKQARRLLPVMLPLLNENEPTLRMAAARVLGRAATQEHLPLLHRMLKQQDMGQQNDAIQALGRIRDKSSIQPLVDMIAYGTGNAYAAAEALGEFGSVAEEAALGLLKEKHLETRRQACQILRKAGTSRSMEALQALIAAGDPQLIHEATETVRAIRQRGEEAEKLVF